VGGKRYEREREERHKKVGEVKPLTITGDLEGKKGRGGKKKRQGLEKGGVRIQGAGDVSCFEKNPEGKLEAVHNRVRKKRGENLREGT